MDRRSFLGATAAGVMGSTLAAATFSATSTLAATPPQARVIVIGGGMGGATVAKYLRLWGNAISVTLIERRPTYTSNIMSSLVLTGQRSLSSLNFGYNALKSTYGITTVFGDVVAIDPVNASVRLADGSAYSADRIVMAPGIALDAVPGLGNADQMPHAWQAGPQTTLLAAQLKALPRRGTVLLTIPKTPYRCPPGPYERACLIADWLKKYKPGSRLMVIDANPDIVTEKDNFSRAFFDLHGGVISYFNNAEVTQADPARMSVLTTAGTFRGDVINLIPRQRAGTLVATAGLNNATEGRFAGVDVLSYASTVPGAEKVHIIGDASATTQPKAGHIANQEAKVCADAISRLLSGGAPDPAPVTNSACYSTITMKSASWLTAGYQYDPATATMVPVAAGSGASNGWNGDNFDEMGGWFQSLMKVRFS
jgi:sulfide dehydrogenase [flavocytochrome c] flavoprotein chain